MTKPEDIKQDAEKPMRDYVVYQCIFCGHKYTVSWGDVAMEKCYGGIISIADCPRCKLRDQGVEIEDVFGNKKPKNSC